MRCLTTCLLTATIACSNVDVTFERVGGLLEGRAFKGPIDGGVVTVARPLTGEVVATGSTDADGHFSIPMDVHVGAFRACVAGGGYVDEATAIRVELEASEMCTSVTDFQLGEVRAVVITPWTDWAYARAEALMRLWATPYPEAAEQARAEVDALLSCDNPALSIIDIEPLDPTVADIGGLERTPGLLSGLYLGGLGQQAVMISERVGLTPGVAVTSLTLAQAYARDLRRDGVFDGLDGAGPIDIEGYPFGPDTLRGAQEGFAQGVRSFLLSPRNATSLGAKDLQSVLSCLATAEGPLFVDLPAGTLDVDGPALTFDAPAAGASVAGIASIHVQANDDSEIEDLWLEDGPGLMGQSTALDGRAATLDAAIDTVGLADGPYTLTARATDIHGNESSAAVQIDINNQAPLINFTAPASGAPVSGVVTIRATAADPQGVASFVFSDATIIDLDAAVDVVETTWDTTQILDGSHVIEVQATDSEANTSTAALILDVQNLAEGSIDAAAFMDSPVQSVAFQVLALNGDGSRGALLASSGTSASGNAFAAAMPDSYAGPILVRAFGAGAHYTNVATGDPVALGAADELLLATEYAPSPAGTNLGPLSINALTTLAAAVSVHRMASGEDASAAIATGNRLVAEHLQRPQSFDLTLAAASDFTGDPAADALESQKLGLVHAGLSQLGSAWASEASLPPNSLSSVVLLRRLLADLEDGVLNGLDGSGAAIQVTDLRDLTTNTLRSDTALAMVDWLDGGQNQSSLVAGNFTQTGGLLDLMSSNTSELFGPEAPETFDIFGPSLDLTQPVDGQAVSGTVTIVATASDPSGVQLILPYVDYQVSTAVGPDQDGSAPGFTATLDTTALSDGPHNLRLVAVDTRDNIAIHDFTIVVDNSAPAITVSGPSLTGQALVTITGTAEDPHTAVVSVELFVDGVSEDLIMQPGATYSSMLTVPCNAVSTVSALAVNETGLSAMDSVDVGCDDRAPTIGLLASSYWPASDLTITYDTMSSSYVYTPPASSPTDLNLLTWTAPGPTLDKLINRLDSSSSNIPTLLLAPDDFGQAGTNAGSPAEEILVDYRYYADGILVRDWQSVAYSPADTAFPLPISLATTGAELADATATTAQRVVVRVTDPQGNRRQRNFNFTMQVSSPPIYYSDCNLGYLEGRTLASDTLHEWFSFDNPSFFSGRLIFPDFASGSLAPWTYDLQIDPVSVTFEELARSQRKTTSALPGCLTTPNPQNWCTSSNNGASADPGCWVQVPNKEMHRLLSAGDPTICWDNLWPLGPPANVTPALGTNTFAGSPALLFPWDYDPVGRVWHVPNSYLRSPTKQPAQFLMSTDVARPPMNVPDAAGPPFAWLQTPKHGGGFGYYVRSHTGIELIRQWDGAGLDFHWSREFEAREYIQTLQVTAPRPPVTIIIPGVGFAPLVALPSSGCGGDIVRMDTE